MVKKSTLEFLNYLLKENKFYSENIQFNAPKNQTEPSKETIDIILAYANSVDIVKTKLDNNFLISLN